MTKYPSLEMGSRVQLKFGKRVLNRCMLTCVKYYENRVRFTVIISICLGVSFFLRHGVFNKTVDYSLSHYLTYQYSL
jgi:hypothetical protein